ncbi:hypothetical protein FRC14_003645 [Serendipita sp. 396]|nr:hypothetical protein FRC14_003645 [Serendipita sp. 396]
MASTSSSAYNTEGRETGREATLHERDASSATTRQRVVSISVSIPEGTHLARNRSRSAGSSPKLKKRSLTLPSWLKGRTSGATSPVAVAPPSSVSIPVQATEANSVSKEQSIRARKLFRDKGRTQSVPVSPRFSYLLTADAILQSGSPSVVSEVAEVVNPAVQPVEEVSLFETMLPYEARIGVLAQLVVLHQEEFERWLKSGEWNSVYASQQRWIGKDAGMRELIKLTRVSKSWMVLALDGQLWQSFDLKAFPGLAPSLVMKIAQGAGAFVHTLNLQGHTYLKPSSLVAISSSLSLSVEQASPVTQLTTINLVGCATLTNHSLHFLLLRSPNVRNLYLHGLDCVTSATLSDILGPRCPRLVVLDIRRCHHVSASGLSSFAVQCHTRALAERTPCPLKVLKIAGVKGTDVEVMRNVGRAFPRLQVLDASYCRDLTDECFSAFVEWPTTTTITGESSAGTEMAGDTGSTLFGKFVELSSREAGLDPGDPSRHLRRITSLRHLNVSGCRHISDKACSNLAYCVPRLEFLEMAAVGGEVKDEGLVRLFRTTKLIKRIDLEDASEITDMGSEIVAIDCRAVSESAIRDLQAYTRPRRGWRGWEARELEYEDGRSVGVVNPLTGVVGGPLIGQDECAVQRVVVKSFHSWVAVDTVAEQRAKRVIKSTQAGIGKDMPRWLTQWSLSRRASSALTPTVTTPEEREDRGCIVQ